MDTSSHTHIMHRHHYPAIRILIILLVLSGITAAVVTQRSGPNDDIVHIGEMTFARAAHQTTHLESGEVLVTGGCTGRCDSTLATAEVFDPVTRSFRVIGEMTIPRNSHVARALSDGRVLLAGGWSDRIVTSTAEIYDPSRQSFTGIDPMHETRAASASAVLADGRVLITGGQNDVITPLASAEIFDPATSKFLATGAMHTPRVAHTAIALNDGRVLVAGGRQARRDGVLRSAEIYDPATGVFAQTGEMSVPRHKHAAALLADGRVLIIGGSDERDSRGRYSSTEIYDPATSTFSPGPHMQWPRFKLPDAVASLPDGDVFIAGGSARPERYDHQTQSMMPLNGSMHGSREFATATPLPGGQVLVLGGYDGNIQTHADAWLITIRKER